jgi:uncharacterized protein with PIN domain
VSVLYVETSAVLAWLLGEPAGVQVRHQVDSAETVVTSVLTSVETARVLTRAEHDGTLRARDARALRGMLRRATAGWIQMELTADIRDRAAAAFPVEPVRTLDALHLATVLEFAEAFPDVALLSLDRRVRENAEEFGVPVVG